MIADVRDIYRGLDKTLIQKLVDLGVRYQWYTPSKHGAHYKSWQDVSLYHVFFYNLLLHSYINTVYRRKLNIYTYAHVGAQLSL